MPELTRLEANADRATILAAIERDGAVILEHFLERSRVDAIVDELWRFIDRTAPVGDDFAGHHTTRTGGLVARSKHVRTVLTEPTVLGAAQDFLEPHCDKLQLNVTQIIRLLPGQGAQELHRDRFIWGKYLPREVEPQLNTIWALTDFSAENGATQVVPGSHRWDWERVAQDDEVAQAVMPKGSVMIYTGSVIHGGGRNDSTKDRIAMNLTYAAAWLRQEENHYLSCPPEIAKDLDPTLQSLLGYTMANYGLGYFSPTEFVPDIPDTLPPEFAVGRLAGVPEAEVF